MYLILKAKTCHVYTFMRVGGEKNHVILYMLLVCAEINIAASAQAQKPHDCEIVSTKH